MFSKLRRMRRVIGAVLIVVLASGCSLLGLDGLTGLEGRLTDEELRAQLREFAVQFIAAVQEASHRISSQSRDIDVRRAALYWQRRTIPACVTAVSTPDTREALFNTWVLCLQIRNAMVGGEISGLSAEARQIATESTARIVEGIEEIGRRFLPKSRLPEIHGELEKYAREHPLSRSATGTVRLASMDEESHMFDWVSSIPLPSLNPLGGINDTAQAVREFSEVADRFTDVVALLPLRFGWELDSTIYDLESSPALESVVESAAKVAETSARLVETVDRLPAEIEGRVSAIVDGMGEAQADLRRTLEDARGVAGDLDRMLDKAESVAGSIGRATESFDHAGRSWEATLTVLDRLLNPPPEPAPEPAEEGFDLEDVAPSARELATAAIEIRTMLDEVRRLLAGDEVARTADVSTAVVRGAVGFLTLMACLVIVVFFAALLGYRLAIARVVGRRGGQSPRPDARR